MKTTPRGHQLEGRRRLRENIHYYALGCEQGTGKTWMMIDDIEWQAEIGNVTGALVIAPKGVHTNWVRREIPTHMSSEHRAFAYRSGAGVRERKKWECLLEGRTDSIAILTMNIDAINSQKGYAMAERFLKSQRCAIYLDESSRIKNPSAKRTKKAIALGRMSYSRRIASGTMLTNGPLDLYSQMEFLHPGLLGTTSYRAFVAEFAQLLPPDNPIVQEAMRKARFKGAVPQIVAKGIDGRPKWKNLEKLKDMLRPYVYRVLKSECLDLPPKVFSNVFFELSPEEKRAYSQVKEQLRYEFPDGEIDTFNQLSAQSKMRQAASGFIMRDGSAEMIYDGQTRAAALKDFIQDLDGQFIIYAHFKEEIKCILKMFDELGISTVEYHGDTKDAEREEAIDKFQSGEVTAFVANPQAAGIGLTLTNAKTVIYYSNDFNLDTRLQSEDRAHRDGLKHTVAYVDLVAEGTIDERIASSLQAKEQIAKLVIDEL